MRKNDTQSCDRNPIDVLVLDYDVPQEIANRMVGRNQDETARNIKVLLGYIEHVVTGVRGAMVDTLWDWADARMKRVPAKLEVVE